MSWRGGALALAAMLSSSSCASGRRWTEDESGRIDAVMAGEARVDAGAGPDAGAGEEEELGLAMGPAPPLAEPTAAREQLSPKTPWSEKPFRRGKRFYLGYRRRSPVIGWGAAARERGATR